MLRCLAPTTCVNFRPGKSTLHSASLFEVLNPSHSAYFILKHSNSDEARIRPTCIPGCSRIHQHITPKLELGMMLSKALQL